jgi:hypothetical protein
VVESPPLGRWAGRSAWSSSASIPGLWQTILAWVSVPRIMRDNSHELSDT